MKKRKKINISYIDPSSLSPAKYNPRKWDGPAMEKLTESIKRFGLIDLLEIGTFLQYGIMKPQMNLSGPCL